MKIVFAGSGGTGKTTLAKLIADKYDTPYVKEGVREYMQEKGISHLRDIPAKQTLEMQWWINNEKLVSESDKEDFVTCRSFACHAAYALRWMGREDSLQDKVRSLVEDCRNNMLQSQYNYIFFCPHGAFPIEADGIRSAKEMYQLEINYVILGILTDWEIPYHILQSISIKDRILEIQTIIEGDNG